MQHALSLVCEVFQGKSEEVLQRGVDGQGLDPDNSGCLTEGSRPCLQGSRTASVGGGVSGGWVGVCAHGCVQTMCKWTHTHMRRSEVNTGVLDPD